MRVFNTLNNANRRTMAKGITAILSGEILGGVYPNGTRLTIEENKRRFNVSDSTMHEAYVPLRLQGLVKRGKSGHVVSYPEVPQSFSSPEREG